MLTQAKIDFLHKIYYEDKLFFGRYKLWDYIRNNYESPKISMFDVRDFLEKQPLYQINRRVPREKSTIPVTTLKSGYVQIDLIDMSSYQVY